MLFYLYLHFDVFFFFSWDDCDKGFKYYFNGSLHHLDEIGCSIIGARRSSCGHAATRVVSVMVSLFAQVLKINNYKIQKYVLFLLRVPF